MFETDENTNINNNSEIQNDKNCPILNLLNKQNNERKKKLLYNELEHERRPSRHRGSSEISSSKGDSSNDSKKLKHGRNTINLVLSNIINSDSDSEESKSEKEIKEKEKEKEMVFLVRI